MEDAKRSLRRIYSPKNRLNKNINPLKIIFLNDLDPTSLEKLKKCFANYPGEEEVYFKVVDSGKAKIIKTAYRIANNDLLRQELKTDFQEVLKIVEN